MARTHRKVLEDFRQIRKGEAGYSKGNRRYVNTSTGEVIGHTQFEKRSIHAPVTLPVRSSSSSGKNVSKHGGDIGKKSQEGISRHSGTVQKENHLSRYYKVLDKYIETINRNTKPMGFELLTRQTARQSFEFKQGYKAYTSLKTRERGDARWQFLVDAGIIDEDDDYY